jgi:DNA helicase HerA-like ATPase
MNNEPIGRVIGTEDSTPLEFWVAVAENQFLQLDDVVALERRLPSGETVSIYGIVTQVRARHEGARFDSDVFLIESGVLPAQVSQAARIVATRFEPEIFVPPLPGQEVRRARGQERERALFFDGMDAAKRLVAGLSRDEEPIYVNLEFLDGTRGAHVNISGISGVATKTSYASFLLYSLFHSKVLGDDGLNTKAIVYNIKGEDLLFLDHANSRIDAKERRKYEKLGLPAEPFGSVELWAPPRRADRSAAPDVATRHAGVRSYFWTIAQFCRESLLPFLFADAEDDQKQYTLIVHNVAARLRDFEPLGDGGVSIEGRQVRTFFELARLVAEHVEDESTRARWAGPAMGQGTVNAFVRRLYGAVSHVEHLVRGDIPQAERHAIRREAQVTVIDLHNLNDRAKRFVVGVTLRRAFEEKERSGLAKPLLFVVLDELNKYAPRDGTSPIKETLLDVAERGRSLGIILIGAEQTASEVERRIIANSAIRVVGRLDTAEAARDEYGFLPAIHRQRATIVKPGTMILSQPELPVPLVTQFPFPSWATRRSEALTPIASGAKKDSSTDPFDGLT